MLKNYNKEGQKLPLFGIGPYMIFGMGVITLLGIILFGYVFKIGILEEHWVTVFRITGALLIISGIFIWFTGAVRSDMDACAAGDKLAHYVFHAYKHGREVAFGFIRFRI